MKNVIYKQGDKVLIKAYFIKNPIVLDIEDITRSEFRFRFQTQYINAIVLKSNFLYEEFRKETKECCQVQFASPFNNGLIDAVVPVCNIFKIPEIEQCYQEVMQQFFDNSETKMICNSSDGFSEFNEIR